MTKNVLSIKMGNDIYLYELKYNDVEKLLTKLNENYRNLKKDNINVSFIGAIPANYGKYQYMDDCKVIAHKVLNTTYLGRVAKREDYTPYGGNGVNRWDMMTEEEKLMEQSVGGPVKGNLEVTVEYPSVIVSAINSALFENKEKDINLINFTDLIKIYNHLMGNKNNFIYDSTFEAKEKGTFLDPIRKFSSVEEFNSYLKDSAKNLNKDNIKLNDNEKYVTTSELKNIVNSLFEEIEISFIGSFDPQDFFIRDIELLSIFGIRNEQFLEFLPNISNIEELSNIENNDFLNLSYDYDINLESKRRQIAKEIREAQEQKESISSFKKIKNMRK